MFQAYSDRHIILAFKFMRKQRQMIDGEIVYKSRKIKEYYKIIKFKKEPKSFPVIKCNYNGDTFAIYKTKIRRVRLKDYDMPFKH
jgi:Holliday junction resolvase